MNATLDVSARPIQARVNTVIELCVSVGCRVRKYAVESSQGRMLLTVHLTRLDGTPLDTSTMQQMLRSLGCPWEGDGHIYAGYGEFGAWVHRYAVGSSDDARYVLVGDRA